MLSGWNTYILVFAQDELTTIFFVRSYDPENDSWTAGDFMLTVRGDSGVAVVNDLIYVIGGENANGIPFSADPPSLKKYATNEQYKPFGYGTIPPKVSVASPTVPVVAVSIVAVALVAGLLVYHKKHKSQVFPKNTNIA